MAPKRLVPALACNKYTGQKNSAPLRMPPRMHPAWCNNYTYSPNSTKPGTQTHVRSLELSGRTWALCTHSHVERRLPGWRQPLERHQNCLAAQKKYGWCLYGRVYRAFATQRDEDEPRADTRYQAKTPQSPNNPFGYQTPYVSVCAGVESVGDIFATCSRLLRITSAPDDYYVHLWTQRLDILLDLQYLNINYTVIFVGLR